ncbi:hypothetical protein AUEXF2481DRAFT_26517 [Aureobasidium subglaciale EXF-2481]|uniref:Uncharacterized protein n=1 Tax=Aureobasidium subglaciale (strain EXF-2481) TaxID=1043005 RepID=A0A074YK27_AURSE|nr:uncharacterized protein AUEXF2481DRAFT_26517 [Aureobasidium subglaciale EXF-2481]KEQ98118.1 hypothetical protein AUEXF2481DRAFT_26517 [Aureobasidium subglaciale EXF-2481]
MPIHFILDDPALFPNIKPLSTPLLYPRRDLGSSSIMRFTLGMFSTLSTIAIADNIFESLFSVATSNVASVYGEITSRIPQTSDTLNSLSADISSLRSQYSSLISVSATATGSVLSSLSSDISSIETRATNVQASVVSLQSVIATRTSSQSASQTVATGAAVRDVAGARVMGAVGGIVILGVLI